MVKWVRGKGRTDESQNAKLMRATYKLIGLLVIINGIAALTVYLSNSTQSELMPYSLGTILSEKTRLIWSYGINLMNFLTLAAFLTHLKHKVRKSNEKEYHT